MLLQKYIQFFGKCFLQKIQIRKQQFTQLNLKFTFPSQIYRSSKGFCVWRIFSLLKCRNIIFMRNFVFFYVMYVGKTPNWGKVRCRYVDDEENILINKIWLLERFVIEGFAYLKVWSLSVENKSFFLDV